MIQHAYEAIHSGFMHLAAGLSVGLTGLAAGYAIGVVGDVVCGSICFFYHGLTIITHLKFLREFDRICNNRASSLAWF